MAEGVPDQVQEKWWRDKPVRMIQTNLREIDARDFEVAVME